jgi:predicted Zn-dependent protease
MLKNKFKASVFLFFLLFISAGCATLYNPATGRNEFILINTPAEINIGKNIAAEISKKQALITEQIPVSRVQTIGKRLSAVSERKDIEYKFYVLADEELNALSLPGGFIYINKGLLDILNDSELAFVLGHEIGHVTARHAVKKIQSNMAYQMLASIAFAGLESKTSGLVNIAKSANIAYNLIGLGYSREDEFESDRLGAKYAFKAGFGPNAALTSLEKLKGSQDSGPRLLVYLRTHPYVNDRISALKNFIPELKEYSNDKKQY